MFKEEKVKKILNHKCLNCNFIRLNKNFQSCYCELTQSKIHFNRDVETFCPLLTVALTELSAPYIIFGDKSFVHVEVKDGGIYLIEKNTGIYHFDIGEYRYNGIKFKIGQGHYSYEGVPKSIKYSDIVRFVSDGEMTALKYADVEKGKTNGS